MANEIEQKENLGDSPLPARSLAETTNPAPDKASQNRVTELENLIAQKLEELAKTDVRLHELEQGVITKDSEVATLKQTKAELEEKLTAVSHSLTEAITSYKTLVIQANPEVIAELISGDTIELVNESLSTAKNLVTKVKQGIEAANSLARVPAGAPERVLPDFSALSPREKIQYAIGKIR